MDIQALLALQEEDGRLRDLQRELKVLLPGRRDEAEKRLDEAKQRVKAAEAEHLQAVKEFEHFNRQYQRDRDRSCGCRVYHDRGRARGKQRGHLPQNLGAGERPCSGRKGGYPYRRKFP